MRLTASIIIWLVAANVWTSMLRECYKRACVFGRKRPKIWRQCMP